MSGSEDARQLVDAVVQRYLESKDFNGLPIRDIQLPPDERNELIEEAVKAGLLSVQFGDRHPNPHIQAFTPEPIETQLTKLRTLDLSHACLYPTATHMASVLKPADHGDKPYRRALASGEPQLSLRYFELKVLEHYRNDPRFAYETDDIQGFISIRDQYYQAEDVPDRDKVLLQQFGFAYDKDVTTRVVAVLLYDLSRLSAEHQQVWRANEVKGDFIPHPGFWDSVLGHFSDRVSIFQAFVEELRVVNKMAEAMGRPPLFREDFEDKRKPRELSFLIRPTLAEFNASAHFLDKLLSENLSLDFFRNEVATETIEARGDGANVVRSKGSLTILNEWLDKTVRFPDPTDKNKMIAAFKKIRKVRQKPAHAINENEFDQKYFREQRQLVLDAYSALRTLRLILANHPAAKSVSVPDWLFKGEIWTQ